MKHQTERADFIIHVIAGPAWRILDSNMHFKSSFDHLNTISFLDLISPDAQRKFTTVAGKKNISLRLRVKGMEWEQWRLCVHEIFPHHYSILGVCEKDTPQETRAENIRLNRLMKHITFEINHEMLAQVARGKGSLDLLKFEPLSDNGKAYLDILDEVLTVIKDGYIRAIEKYR